MTVSVVFQQPVNKEGNAMLMRIRYLVPLISVLCGLGRAQNIHPITPEKIEFGRIQEGKAVDGDIRFVNAGKAPVQIQRVQASCGCTTTQIEKMRVEPGDTASIHYSVRTQGFRGTVRKSITVYFADPKEKELQFVIQGTLFSELDVTPSFIDFQGIVMDANSTVAEKVTLQNQTQKPIMMKSARASSGQLTVTPQSGIIAPGQMLTLRVTLKPSKAAAQDADVWIETDSATRPKITIPVFIQIEKKK
jgi:P pilus assembly chaperone PapD